MLEAILGSVSKERVFLYLFAREKGYAREIALFYGTSVTPIKKQLEALETQNVLYCEPQGRTLIYRFNPRYPFLKPLKQLLEETLAHYPAKFRDELLLNRRRPRRRGKPL